MGRCLHLDAKYYQVEDLGVGCELKDTPNCIEKRASETGKGTLHQKPAWMSMWTSKRGRVEKICLENPRHEPAGPAFWVNRLGEPVKPN